MVGSLVGVGSFGLDSLQLFQKLDDVGVQGLGELVQFVVLSFDLIVCTGVPAVNIPHHQAKNSIKPRLPMILHELLQGGHLRCWKFILQCCEPEMMINKLL